LGGKGATEDILKQAQINEKLMIQYAKKTAQVSEHIPLTYTAACDIRCPFYPSECSGFSDLLLHECMMYNVPSDPPEFFSLDLRNVMRQENGSVADAGSDYAKMTPKQQASVMMCVSDIH
jgi:hypothetical protein